MSDPSRYIVEVGTGTCILLPAKIVALINAQLAPWRIHIRGRNPDLDAALLDMAHVAMTVATPARATNSVAIAKPAAHSDEWMTTSAAAGLIGITESAVRKAIAEGRLDAQKLNAGWCITRQAVEQYRINRIAA